MADCEALASLGCKLSEPRPGPCVALIMHKLW